MEELFMNLAKSSPIAVVAIFALWRMSIVMVVIAEGLVKSAQQRTEPDNENADKHFVP